MMINTVSFTTLRLFIQPLATSDNHFMFALVNTPSWLKFIGNHRVTSPAGAAEYIEKAITDVNKKYWIVRLLETKTPIGVLTLIKRSYLQHHDIGFAFLPQYEKKGYAYEATTAFLNTVFPNYDCSHLFAITVPENVSSINLLTRLGLTFQEEIHTEKERLHVYGASRAWLIRKKETL